jgi:hypothetical protein
MRRLSHEGRLVEALDVPDDLYDAADGSGAALLAALLCGHQRMLVDVADASLDRCQLQLHAEEDADDDDDGSSRHVSTHVHGTTELDTAKQAGEKEQLSTKSSEAAAADLSASDLSDLPFERVARFVELMALPTIASLEGVRTERSRVHIIFNTARQLDAARRVMTIAGPGVRLGCLAVPGSSSLKENDAVLIVVSPVTTPEEGGGKGSAEELQRLLKSAENRTIIVVNPVGTTLENNESQQQQQQQQQQQLFESYQPVYVLKGMRVRYQAKKTAADSLTEQMGQDDNSDSHASGDEDPLYLHEEAASEWADSVWGNELLPSWSDMGLGDFYSDEREAQVIEQELGPPLMGEGGSERTSEAGGTANQQDQVVGAARECSPTLQTNDWVAAAAAAVAASEEGSEFSGFDEVGSPSELGFSPSSMMQTSSREETVDEFTKDFDEDEREFTGSSDMGAVSLESEARAVLLREFPMPWRAFLQFSSDESRTAGVDDGARMSYRDEENGGKGLEQPWIFLESFESRPSRSDMNVAILNYIDEAIGDENENA